MKINLRKSIIASLVLAGFVLVSACNKKNSYNGEATLIREWQVQVSSNNVNYPTSSTETYGKLTMQLYSDNSLRYDLPFDQNFGGVSGATINLGNPVTDGPMLVNLNPRTTGTYLQGVNTGLRQSFIDTLLNNSIPKYFNVFNTAFPSGVARGQLDTRIIYSQNVALSGNNVVPPVATSTTGLALLRITDDNRMYYRINIYNPDSDPVTSATLHMGAAGTNGSSVAVLLTAPNEFNTPRMISANSSLLGSIQSNSMYINVASALRPFPQAKLRGQIR